MLAERYFPEDPNTSLLKLRQLGELLAQLLASRTGLYLTGRGAAIRPVAAVAGRWGPAARGGAALRRGAPRRQCGQSCADRGPPHGAVRAQDQLAARALVSPHLQGQVLQVRAVHSARGRRRMRAPSSRRSSPSLKQKLDEYEATHSAEARALEATLDAVAGGPGGSGVLGGHGVPRRSRPRRRSRPSSPRSRRCPSCRSRPQWRRSCRRQVAAAQSVVLDEAETRKLIDAQLRAGGLGGRHGRALLRQGRAAGERTQSRHCRVAHVQRARRLRAVRRA